MAPTAHNRRVIEEFRATGGRVGGYYEGRSLVILHTIGAKSGIERENPLMALPDGDALVVFASQGGAPTHPDWYRNLRANPDVTVEFQGETFPARATVVDGPERERLYARIIETAPVFATYRERTAGIREIPVVALKRAG
jgi:deazaflavin-dependent oxidoreductase (nitroreductase family)